MRTAVLQRSIYVSHYINVNVLSLMLALYALAIHARQSTIEKLMFVDFFAKSFFFFNLIFNIDFFGRHVKEHDEFNLQKSSL